MNNTTSKDQEVWNNGFDYFFERKKEQKPTLAEWGRRCTVWNAGFIAASNYCEHLLKEASGTDI